ncbi:2809_t:CDS:2 [Scutellospora calospora]|uniref:2809_t:CDS:1 n=1 Tax=Scutellospora calospora TaxID=85575 RepID=A0ACA9KE43_9GLOM|nr:2809_t:CDS:2 [Scutellospora calospora]
MSKKISNIFTKTTNNFNKDSNSLDEVVKELCNLYNEEKSKFKSTVLIFEIFDQFIAEKKQSPDNIINWCLNDEINPTIALHGVSSIP